jgi:hypothetical protein
MRRLALTLVLPASLLLIGSVDASPIPERLARMARASVIIPSEWDGTWTTLDTIYTCQGVFQSTSTDADTLCGGKDYSEGPNSLVCTGTADATTLDVTCTGSEPVITDCDANYSIVIHGTRTASTYFTVTTINITYSGTGCGPIPPTCVQINTHGTRTGPAPTEYCATSTRRTTWGEIKALYR